MKFHRALPIQNASRPRRRRPPSGAIALVALLLALFAGTTPAAAQSRGSFDLTPALTYHLGGSFDVYDFEFGRVDFDIDDSDGLALFFGIPVTRALQVELIAIRQETGLSIDQGLFSPDFFLDGLDLAYYHGGLLWAFPFGQIEPYVAFSLGVTEMEFDTGLLSSDTLFSASFGGGFKTRFTPHFGLRFDGRFFFTDLSDDYDDDFYCSSYGCDDNAFVQGVVSGGLLFSF